MTLDRPDGTEKCDPDRARRAVFVHMRHELGAPLNAIIGYSEMLLEDVEEVGQTNVKADLRNIHEAGRHLFSLFHSLLEPDQSAALPSALNPHEAGSAIRHQIRTPLDAIVGYSEMLLEEAASTTSEEYRNNLRHIHAAGMQLVGYVEDIVRLATQKSVRNTFDPKVEALSNLVQDAFTPTPLPEPDRRVSRNGGGSLLVVDDNAINVDILSRYLQRQGYEVAAAAGGREALHMLKQRAFDLILLDIIMPDMNGYQVLQYLKSDETLSGIPVIFISALDDTIGKVQAFRAGGVDYVTKPFQAEEVIARVENQLKISRLQKDLARQNQELIRKNEELLQAQRRTDLVFSALSDVLPGTVLDGRYRLEDKIGTGGFGAVYRGIHLGLNHLVAVKVFRPLSGNDTPEALERFRQEGISASRVKHPNAVEIFDNGISASGIAYLVMEFLQGHTLAAELQEKKRLAPSRALDIIVPACEALAAVHAAGIVHRDIKPENIYLHCDSGGEVVKLLDFGVSKMLGTADPSLRPTTMSVGIVGTPAYMAPERLMGQSYDGRSDVYSMGVVLYWMISGKWPFPSEENTSYAMAVMHLTAEPVSLRVHDPDLPSSLDALVQRMLSKEPQRRPTAKELAQQLRDLPC